MQITASQVKELRERTGSGMMECKKALEACEGNTEKAIDFLREKGLAKAAKKAERSAKDGCVFSYIHNGGRVGVLLEFDCETDFVGRTEEFQNLGHELCMQVAAANPSYISSEDVPADVVEREKAVYRQQLIDEGKPADKLDRIIEGKINKYYEQVCLMDQVWIRDGDKKIKDLIVALIAKLGENMKVRRFARFAIGE